MLNQLSMVFGIICCLLGTLLLFGAISKSESSVVVGAALTSLGVLVAFSSLRSWLKWKEYKKTQKQGAGKLASNLNGLQRTGPLELRPARQQDSQKRRRSQRVMLQVAVLIKAEIPGGNLTQAHAFAAVVNAHGGLLECPMRMTAGQRMTLVNPQSAKEVGCRIVQVQQSSEGFFTTSFEFDERSPQFWPLTLPPVDWGLTQELANGNG